MIIHCGSKRISPITGDCQIPDTSHDGCFTHRSGDPAPGKLCHAQCRAINVGVIAQHISADGIILIGRGGVVVSGRRVIDGVDRDDHGGLIRKQRPIRGAIRE